MTKRRQGTQLIQGKNKKGMGGGEGGGDRRAPLTVPVPPADVKLSRRDSEIILQPKEAKLLEKQEGKKM